MSSLVFRKTESGRAEVSLRKAGLSPVTRRVLIMVNGQRCGPGPGRVGPARPCAAP